MEQAYECAKSALLRFKLERCCCLAPIRVGLLITGYFNLFISVSVWFHLLRHGLVTELTSLQMVCLFYCRSKDRGYESQTRCTAVSNFICFARC